MGPGDMKIEAGEIELNASRRAVSRAMRLKCPTPMIEANTETCAARADRELPFCEPAQVLSIAQRCFLF